MSTMIEAGKIRHRVTIRQPSNTATDGYESDTYSDLATVWMSIEPLKGRELLEARAQLSSQSFRLRMRYRSGITVRHQLLWNSETYRIESISNPEGRNIKLVLLATVILAGG